MPLILRNEHRSITLRGGVAHYAAPGTEHTARARMKVMRHSAFTTVESILRHLPYVQERKVHNYLFNTVHR